MDTHGFAKTLIDAVRKSVAKAVAQLYRSKKAHMFETLDYVTLADELDAYLYYSLYELMSYLAEKHDFYQEIVDSYTLILSTDMIAAAVENAGAPENTEGLEFQVDLFPQYKGASYMYGEQFFDRKESPEAALIRSLGSLGNPHLSKEAYTLAANVGRRLFKLHVNNFFYDAKPNKLDLSDLLN